LRVSVFKDEKCKGDFKFWFFNIKKEIWKSNAKALPYILKNNDIEIRRYVGANKASKNLNSEQKTK
jgi:hypothetical protein